MNKTITILSNWTRSNIKLTFFFIIALLFIFGYNGFSSNKTIKNNHNKYAYAPPRIGDKVWEDTDGDGYQDATEFGLGNVTVRLYDSGGNLVASTTTSTTAPVGTYVFEDLAPGDYYLEFDASTVDPNYVHTEHVAALDDAEDSDIDDSNGPNTTPTFTLNAGEDNKDIDAGFFINISFGDYVWEDSNGNGVQDAGEPPIENADVSLSGTTGTGAAYGPLNTQTDAAGNYSFTDVPPGTYTIHFDLPAGYDDYTYKDEGGDDNIDSDADPNTGDADAITALSGETYDNIDAGFYEFVSIGDFTWEDLNGNGIQDGGEPGLDGVDVELNGTTGNGTPVGPLTVTSSGGGFYNHDNLVPGTYTLTFIEPTDYHLTYKDEGGDDSIDSDADQSTGEAPPITLASGETTKDIDAGFYKFGTIGDYTWEDTNGNGIQDGEPDLPGVDVTLTGTTGNGTAIAAITVTTGGAGDYIFVDLIPGNYTVNFDLASSGFDAITLQDQGGNDDTDSDPDPATGDVVATDLTSGQNIDNIDAGFYKFVTIGDFVWEDMNGNGAQDGEPGLGDVKVTLTNVLTGDTYFYTTLPDGLYSFSPPTFEIPPGEYNLNFVEPPTYYIIDQDMTSDDLDSDPDPTTGTTINFTINSGETTDMWDAGMYRPGTIGDFTWRDQNTDGLQDASEFPMPNVMVTLYRASDDAIIDQTFTDASGMYLFDNNPDIKPDDYYVEFELPATFLFTVQNAGAEDLDSDPDPTTGLTPVFTIQSGTDTTYIDAGYYVEPPDDCDETQTAGECEDAEVLCELQELNEFCTSMVEQWEQIPIPGCGAGFAFHNPSWFAFVAGAEDVSLIIHAAPCVAGTGSVGIQWGFYEDCVDNPVALQCPCVPPGDIPVTLTGLTVGETYHFFIDGCSGTQCTYWIEILYGGGTPEVNGPLGVICDDNFPDCEDICVGADVTFTLDEVYNAVTYVWDVNGVIDSTSTPDTTIHFDQPGIYDICVYGKNDCNVGDPYCFQVEVEQMPPEDLGSFEVCENVLEGGYTPDNWEGGPLYSEGIDSVALTTDPQGCEYWQKVEIIKLPRDTVYIDTTGCAGDDIVIEGEVFTYDVQDYEITVEGGADNGCDKKVFVTTHFITLDGHFETDCSGLGDNSVKILFYVDQILPENPDSVVVTWYKDGDEFAVQNGNQDSYNIVIYEDGTYSISISVTYDGKTCTFEDFDPEEIYIDDYMPDAPQPLNWPLVVCSNAEDWYYYEITNTDPNNQYIWTWPADAVGVVADDQMSLSVFWQGSAGGDICVNAFDPDCGHSDTICQTVTIIPAPNSPFIVQDTICLSSVDTITYTGIASDTAEYTWNFSGGIDNSPLGPDSQGPHYITWTSAGTKIISLVVNEGGCESEMTVDTVVVQTPPQMPSILCNSTATSITFEWDPIDGASNTTVEVVSGSSGTLNGTTYSVTGLNPNDEVTIILHIETDGYCPNFSTDPITCQALDCPIVDVIATPGDTSICLDGTNQPFNLTYSITPNDGGVISWSGNGITDTLTGLFDPNVAGIGDHTIVLHYLNNECPYNAKAYIHIFEQPTADFTISGDTICIKDQLSVNYSGNAPTGNANWNFDGATIVSGTGLEPHLLKWNTSGLKTINLEVENNNCISTPVSAQVYVQDTLDDIYISCEPSTDSIIFTWNLDNKAEGYKIYVNGTQVDSAFINTYTVNGLTPGDSVNLSLIAIDKGLCGDISASDYCFAVACPDYGIDIQPGIDTICLDDNTSPITFQATISNSDGTGTIEWSGNGIDPVSGVFDPKVAGPGTHTIFMRFKEVCSADTSFTIDVIEKPNAIFNVENATICISDSLVVNFDNNNPAGTVYDWNLAGGTRTDINSSKFSIKWNTPGSYMLSLKTNNSVCESERMFVPVVVEPELIAPVINCSPTTNSIMINWNSIDCASSYNVFVDGEMVLNTTDIQYNLLDLLPNSTVNFTVEAVSECACNNVSTTITCETEPCPDITLQIENLPEYLCISDLTNIRLNVNITGDNSGVISWEGQGIDNNGNINFAGFNPGQYVYTVNYTVQKCDYSTTDTLQVIPLPKYEVSSINPLCYGDKNGGIIVTDDENYEYYLDGVKSDNSTFQNLAAGTYTVTIKDVYGCESSETVTLTEPENMEPTIIGPDFIKENSSGAYEIGNVDNFNIISIVWYFENGDTICSGSQCKNITLSLDFDRTVCVDIVNDNGCEATTCLDIRFIENVDVDIPNIFSPDGDGLNDRFYISGDNTVLSIKDMKIYDRWGELVFSQQNFPPNDASYGWDGNFRGKKVLPGVYVFYAILEIKDREDMKVMGDITIIR